MHLLANNANTYAGDFTVVVPFTQSTTTSSQLIFGFNGNDNISGDPLSSTSGALAVDCIFLSNADSRAFIFLADHIDGGGGNDKISGDILTIDQDGIDLSGTSKNNTFTFGADLLQGGTGNDEISGDVLELASDETGIDCGGTSANNTFNFAADRIEGGGGDDILYGDVNSIGGTPTQVNAQIWNFASDTFVYNLAEVGGLGNDIIKDFNVDDPQILGNIFDKLEFRNVMDVVGNGNGVDINDLVALTDVISNGANGGAKIMIYNSATDHIAANLIGSIDLQLGNVTEGTNVAGFGTGVAYTGLSGGSNEIIDYIAAGNLQVSIV